MTQTDLPLSTFRVGVVLWAALCCGALFVSQAAWLGALLGGGIGLANFWALSRVVRSMVAATASDKGDKKRGALLGVLLASKFLLLLGAIIVAVMFLPISTTWFVLGMSIFVVAILSAATRTALLAGASK